MIAARTPGVRLADGLLGLGTVLFLVSLAFKLTGLVTWSWWLVSAPLWVPAALLAALALTVWLTAWALKGRNDMRRELRRAEVAARGGWQ